ncbi:MAG: methyltransferase domain-containing protein [Massilibacteroides sp.]|nr:methyltransferase domain-containing protein [Massilibacteroides sp.]MDD3062272.1 methyltransferase domain-containing protein [Massilibacteroides sp.]MDD4113989.1 methyltransferase domain-containing protein [Massilibacteroides sp.]MDD4660045.1 methyltransferase domain-containing protein [Massilibacteroides sp.]
MKFIRKARHIFRRPIIFDTIRTHPVSTVFGMDRGTPIDRYYIETFLQENCDYIHGNVLEIAENTYSKKFGKNTTSHKILHSEPSNKKGVIIGDLTDPTTLPEEEIDCFICTQTLNFIFDVSSAIKGSYRLLKKGGCFLGTVSGISQISRYDMERWGDYWRFTNLSIQQLFEQAFEKPNIEIRTFGNVFAANAFLQGLAVEDLPTTEELKFNDTNYQIIIGIRALK